MKNYTKHLVIILLLTLLGTHAQAATLTLTPNTQQVVTGLPFTVDLMISGLSDSSAPSTGVFDIDIGFDPFALAFTGLTFGTELGSVSLGEAIDVSFGLVLPGVLNVAEVSLLSAAELDGSQPDSFVLATLEFVAMPGLDPGQTTAIDILTVFSLGDSNGDPLPVDGTAGAFVTAVVPLPGAVWLFIAALGTLPVLRRIRNQCPV